VSAEIAIEEIPIGKGKRSALTGISGFENSRTEHSTFGFAKLRSPISRFVKKGGSHEDCCGYRFPDREIEEPLKFFRLKRRKDPVSGRACECVLHQVVSEHIKVLLQ
jgi:hypothetical protein